MTAGPRLGGGGWAEGGPVEKVDRAEFPFRLAAHLQLNQIGPAGADHQAAPEREVPLAGELA